MFAAVKLANSMPLFTVVACDDDFLLTSVV